MNLENLKQIENLLPLSYFRQAVDASKSRENCIQQFIHHKKIPFEGWDEQTIEIFLNQLSAMDSNNFPSNCGIGEREARFASNIVARRHFRFGHGIGRSGDLMEIQPKAAGSSLITKLTIYMLKDLLRFMGIDDQVYCILAPVATGMSLVLSLLTLKSQRPNATYVIWSRIDQKACFKSIITAGFKPVVIDTCLDNDQLVTNVEALESKVNELGAENIACIMTTTSCFAPRACDSIEDVAKLCKEYSVPHLINNAYGLQSRYCMNRIQKAHRKGRVDVFVQSTDKNLMVPVGGTIIAGFNKTFIDNISQIYPGRASFSPVLDTFITLLNIGKNGYDSLVRQREELYMYLQQRLNNLVEKFDERVLNTPENPISIGITLNTFRDEHRTKIGSMLFTKNVSGARVIIPTDNKLISDVHFNGWGTHCKKYFATYLTCAASIGMKKSDVDLFIKRLEKVLTKFKKNKENVL